jgi:hypothetical protein
VGARLAAMTDNGRGLGVFPGPLRHAAGVDDSTGSSRERAAAQFITRGLGRATSGSWLNAVEGFFSTLTRRRIRRGVFRSIVDLQAAINRYIREHNDDPKPFIWTKPADGILAKINRLPAPSV